MAKVSDKLVKVDEQFTVNMYDNGFMIEIGGRDNKEDYKTTKIMCSTIDEVYELMQEVVTMERDD